MPSRHPICLNFYYRQTVPGRKVQPLIFSAFDRVTLRYGIVGRQNNNNWVLRSYHPAGATIDGTPDVVTSIRQQFQNFGAGNVLSHVLYYQTDWDGLGGGGSSGVANVYYSTDDGATWTNGTVLSDVLDTSSGNLVLTAGDLYVATSGLAGTAVAPRSTGAGGGYYRIAGDFVYQQIGNDAYHYTVLLGPSGITIHEWRQNVVTAIVTSLADHGPVSYPGAAAIPWHWAAILHGPGGPTAANTYLHLHPGPGEDLYIASIATLIGGGPMSVLYSTGTTPTLNPIVALASGTARNNYLTMWNGSLVLLGFDVPTPSTMSNQIGVISGAEAFWGGTVPQIAPDRTFGTSQGSAPESVLLLDALNTANVLQTVESIRTAYPWLGPLPGEGTSPSYTAKRLVAILRHGTPSIEFVDESGLLDIGPDSWTLQPFFSGQSPLQTSGSHWWNRVP